jgi:ligand-binding SRPBCC domain-containing protein
MTNQIGKLELFDDAREGYRLQAEVVVESPINEVFDFFSSAENLEAITPPWLNFRIITPMPIEMRQGTLLDYKIRLHMIPIRWRTEIAEWQPPFRFADQQLKGPYKRWWHEHTFEDLGNGLTLVKDDVHYIPRGGSLLHRLMVKPDLERIFTYRQQRLAERFKVCTSSAAPPADLELAEA